jgi:glycosyltransferase involved in cell wall biosynthesis
MSNAGIASRRMQARRDRANAGLGSTRFVYTPSAEPCAIETFTRTLVGALGESAGGYAPLPISGRWRDLPHLVSEVIRSDHVIFNFPLVAWKRMIAQPLLLLLAAALGGRRISVFLHEWTALHALRRLVVAPFVVLSDAIVVVSPYIADQLANDRWVGWVSSKCRFLPHPPTIQRPQAPRITERVRNIARAAARYDIVIGTFGSIYKGKASTALLDVCAQLDSRGIRALAVYVGSFTRSLDDYESEFRNAIREKGLEDHVIVTGYVEDEDELFAVFERIGVFLFLFPEGLTARRSSVIACLQSDRPVVVSAPQSPAEFHHHAGWTAMIESGAVALVPAGAGTAQIADLVLAAIAQRAGATRAFDADAWWTAPTEAARAIL